MSGLFDGAGINGARRFHARKEEPFPGGKNNVKIQIQINKNINKNKNNN